MMTQKLRILFTLSIVFNMVIIGGLVGKKIMRTHYLSWHKSYDTLAPETKNNVAKKFQKTRHDLKQKNNKIRHARKNINRVLKAKKFDENAYKNAIQSLEEAQADILAFKTQMSIDLLKNASPKERRAIMRKIMKPMRHKGESRPRFAQPELDTEHESDNEVHQDKAHYYKAFDL